VHQIITGNGGFIQKIQFSESLQTVLNDHIKNANRQDAFLIHLFG
jgi:hypothetical protein